MDPNNPAVKRAETLNELSKLNRLIRVTQAQLDNENEETYTRQILNRQLTDLKIKRQNLLGEKP